MCLDTQILIWGIQKQASAGQEELIERAAYLIQALEKQKAAILIPTPVVTEFLMGTPSEDHSNVLAVLNRRFQIAPFDAASAVLAAKLWQQWKKGPLSPEPWMKGLGREKLKFDCQLVAIAIVHRADCLYSHDNGVPKIAQDLIPVLQVPPITGQQGLPFDGIVTTTPLENIH